VHVAADALVVDGFPSSEAALDDPAHAWEDLAGKDEAVYLEEKTADYFPVSAALVAEFHVEGSLY
jgi:hypothetical protein